MKGEQTLVGKGVRSMTPAYRLVLTATPVKLFRIPFYAAWLAIWPSFPEVNRSSMRHKTGSH
jgi:hypothetical protein